jgi:hypothetical protein
VLERWTEVDLAANGCERKKGARRERRKKEPFRMQHAPRDLSATWRRSGPTNQNLHIMKDDRGEPVCRGAIYPRHARDGPLDFNSDVRTRTFAEKYRYHGGVTFYQHVPLYVHSSLRP